MNPLPTEDVIIPVVPVDLVDTVMDATTDAPATDGVVLMDVSDVDAKDVGEEVIPNSEDVVGDLARGFKRRVGCFFYHGPRHRADRGRGRSGCG